MIAVDTLCLEFLLKAGRGRCGAVEEQEGVHGFLVQDDPALDEVSVV